MVKKVDRARLMAKEQSGDPQALDSVRARMQKSAYREVRHHVNELKEQERQNWFLQGKNQMSPQKNEKAPF